MDEPNRDAEAGQGLTRTPRQRNSLTSFLFLTFIIFMFTNHTSDEFLARQQYQEALQSLSYQLSNFTAWMNGTASNFSLPDGDPNLQPLLNSFLHYGIVQDPERASYFPNLTGFVHTHSNFYNISPLHLIDESSTSWAPAAKLYMDGVNISDATERMGTWNWSRSDRITLSVIEMVPSPSETVTQLPEDITLMHGRIELTDAITSEDLKLDFEGVHFIKNGSIFGFAEHSGRHIDIRLLPSLVPDAYRNVTARFIEPELIARINKLKGLIDAGVVIADLDITKNEEPAKSTCPLLLYAQLDPVAIPQHLMDELESEMQTPTGISTVNPPKLSLHGLLISRECGMMFEIKNSEGLRTRTFFRKVATYAGSAGIAYLLLLYLLLRQMGSSRTPSAIARISQWTLLTQAIVDSVSFAGHTTFAILAEGRASLSLIAPAFLACVLFIHEGQFAVLIRQVQLPEDSVPTPAPTSQATQATPPDGTRNTPVTGAATLPAALRPQTFLSFFMNHIRTDPQAKLWLSLFVFLSFIVRVILSPALAVLFVATSYSCFWLPQIIRSARRGRSSSLTMEYVIGTTVCRLYLALYFLLCPKNVLDVEPRPWAYLLCFFMSLQIAVLFLQDKIGPTFFLPGRFADTNVYDYHPVMSLPDSESPEQSLGDCSICMDAIMVYSSRRRSTEKTDPEFRGRGTGLLNAVVANATTRKSYSLAPCHHLFHTDCLERWLAIKNICPQCRRPLPPL